MGNNCPELKKLISPVTLTSFHSDYFEKKPLYIPREDQSYFDSLLSLNIVSAYLERKDIRYPSIRLVKDGLELPQTDYLHDLPFGNHVFEGLIDNDKLFNRFIEGSTIILQAQHRSLPSIFNFYKSIEEYFKFPLQANIYLTPANSQGFAAHYDNHDVFIIQTHGTKRWNIYDSPVLFPTQPFDKTKWTKKEPEITVELKQGDTLYLPRGFIHEASTSDAASLHITLGLLTYTWIDALRMLIEESHLISDFRKSFNWNELPDTEMSATIKKLLNKLSDNISPVKVRSIFNKRFERRVLKDDKQRLNDIVNSQYVNAATRMYVRRDVIYEIENQGDSILLSFSNKQIEFPGAVNNSLTKILNLKEFSINELDEIIDEAGLILLCQILVQEGLLTIN